MSVTNSLLAQAAQGSRHYPSRTRRITAVYQTIMEFVSPPSLGVLLAASGAATVVCGNLRGPHHEVQSAHCCNSDQFWRIVCAIWIERGPSSNLFATSIWSAGQHLPWNLRHLWHEAHSAQYTADSDLFAGQFWNASQHLLWRLWHQQPNASKKVLASLPAKALKLEFERAGVEHSASR